jgi:hypothetical protein
MRDPRKILGWNDRGELRFHGETISGYHVTDLLKDSQYEYKSLKPIGTDQFYDGLREINIPQNLIGNTQRRGVNVRPPGIPVHKGKKMEKEKWIMV